MSVVLVVDDEPDVRLVARVVLTSAGHEIIEAGSGEEALEKLATSTAPDVMLLDVRMPGLTGWDVLAKLRENPEHNLPVVVFTADHAAMAEAPVRLDEERELFLAKPFDPEDLISTIQRALASAN